MSRHQDTFIPLKRQLTTIIVLSIAVLGAVFASKSCGKVKEFTGQPSPMHSPVGTRWEF